MITQPSKCENETRRIFVRERSKEEKKTRFASPLRVALKRKKNCFVKITINIIYIYKHCM